MTSVTYGDGTGPISSVADEATHVGVAASPYDAYIVVTPKTPPTTHGVQVTARFKVLTPPTGHVATPTRPQIGCFGQTLHLPMAV